VEIYDAETSSLLASQRGDPLLNQLTRTIVRHVHANAPRGRGVLDAGCGTGRTALALAETGFPTVGIDPSQRVIELCNALPLRPGTAPLRFEVGDATQPIPDVHRSAYEAVVCSEVLEHVEQPDKVVEYCRAALRPGGLLVLTVPHSQRQWTRLDEYAGHLRRFSSTAVRELLADGFEVEGLETEGFPFARLLARLHDLTLRRSGEQHDFAVVESSRLYKLYLRVMPLLLRVDHSLRRLRLGTTIVVVARSKAG